MLRETFLGPFVKSYITLSQDLSKEAFIEPQVCESNDQRSLNVASVPREACGKNYNRGSRRGSAFRWSSSRHGRIHISRHSGLTTLADSRGDRGRSCISVFLRFRRSSGSGPTAARESAPSVCQGQPLQDWPMVLGGRRRRIGVARRP